MELFVKEIGVVRKIDELGRVVIPKEMRRSLGIRDGESLEIFVDNQSICLKKTSLLLSLENIATTIIQYAYDTMGLSILVMDRDKVVASLVPDYLNTLYNPTLNRLLEERESYVSKVKEVLFPTTSKEAYYYVVPLIVSGDALGLLLLEESQEIDEIKKKIMQFIAKLLVNKIDIL